MKIILVLKFISNVQTKSWMENVKPKYLRAKLIGFMRPHQIRTLTTYFILAMKRYRLDKSIDAQIDWSKLL